jgi:hypothetical protein
MPFAGKLRQRGLKGLHIPWSNSGHEVYLMGDMICLAGYIHNGLNLQRESVRATDAATNTASMWRRDYCAMQFSTISGQI